MKTTSPPTLPRLSDLRRLVHRNAAALNYVVLDLVLNRRDRVPVGRVLYSEEALAPWLGGPVKGKATSPLTEALLRWVTAEVPRHMDGQPRRTFKLRLYSAKGGYLVSRNFQAEAAEAAPAPTPPPEPPPDPRPPPRAVPEPIPELRAWRALFEALGALLDRMQQTAEHLTALQARTADQQAARLDANHRLIAQLAAQLAVEQRRQRREEAELDGEQARRQGRKRLALVALRELGALGRVIGLAPPEQPEAVQAVLDLLAASPELAQALADSRVRALLQDPEASRALAELLMRAARGEEGS